MTTPGFVALARSGELEAKLALARAAMLSCALCPRRCGVDRTSGDLGYCGAGTEPRIYGHMAHSGEEPPISGVRGSGVVFFSHCTMSCRYCQNYRMSRLGEGARRTAAGLASMISALADSGCHNLNLVSATQYIPSVLEALLIAAHAGVSLPVVWNTSGYECSESLRLLDGVVDVYLADARYASAAAAARYSDAADYVAVNRAALRDMESQVGPLALDEGGLAVKGLIVRHLVLPNAVAGTEEVLRFVSRELGAGTHVSLMAQYYPAHLAGGEPEIARRITRKEWARAKQALECAGLTDGWVQQYPDGLCPIAGTEVEPDGDHSSGPPG